MDPQELIPLESGLRQPRRSVANKNCYLAPRTCYTAPLKLCRLLALVMLLPSMFIMIPLYMSLTLLLGILLSSTHDMGGAKLLDRIDTYKYRVFSGQIYPMSMTDMRLIDSKISPTWCQRQVVRSNTTFNAFVVPGPPELMEDLVPVSMTRELELEDDMKEYWGFYLLKGSSVTVSACTRWPGASLIMIKGYKHLQECAYIGDDSSEEVDELKEAFELGLLSNTSYYEKINQLKIVDGKANDPDTMRRHKAGVSFHDPNKVNATSTSSESVPAVDVTDHDPKELREILERLHALREAAKIQNSKNFHPPDNIVSLPALHRHRDANVDKDERKWLSFQDIDGNNSDVVINNNKEELSNKINIEIINDDISDVKNKTDLLNDVTKSTDFEIKNDTTVKSTVEKETTTAETKLKIQEEMEIVTVETTYETITEVKIAPSNNKETTTEANSKEVFEDVLTRLQALGDKGKRVLVKLHETMGVEYKEKPPIRQKSDIMSLVTGSGEELDRLRRVLVEAIDEEKTRAQRQQKRLAAAEQARNKRESMLGQIELVKIFNENDEERNHASEVDADGFADHHQLVNETTPLDMSNSEFWSSFSSSEEALLECEGLILNLPLTPHRGCVKEASEGDSFAAAKANALTYRVPANGYYFFVFNSENEVQKNFIRARFELQKTRYDVARTKLRECLNRTERCDLNLDIFSSQKVVLEVPLRNNDSLWNEQFVIISECEPRTSIYIVCVIAVPILILLFAFQ